MARLTRTQKQVLTNIRRELVERRTNRQRQSRFGQPVPDDLAIEIMAAILGQDRD